MSFNPLQRYSFLIIPIFGIIFTSFCPTTYALEAKLAKPITLGEYNNFLPVGKRSEEHTSQLQSQAYLVCRLLLEKKKK